MALTINVHSQKLNKEYYDWAKTKIKREYYSDAYGTLNGPYKAYSEYGGIMKQGQCKDDGPIGKWIENYDNGKLRYIKIYDTPGTYDFQVKDGKIIAYYEDGKTIKYERNFRNMNLDGDWKEYNEKGELTKEGKYVNGVFEPTGITKKQYEEEQEKKKQIEAENLLKKAQEYKATLLEAENALQNKNYMTALQLFRSGAELMPNENYPAEKIAEIKKTLHKNSAFFTDFYKTQYDSLKLDKMYYSSSIPVRKTGHYPGWDVMKYGKITYAVFNNNNRIYPLKVDQPWESIDTERSDVRYDDESADWVLNDLNSNKAFYTPIQMLVTESFVNYHMALQKEKAKIRDSELEYSYEYNQPLYSYDKDLFVKSITPAKNSYLMVKSLVDLEGRMLNKKAQIETLNKSNKKKTLYNKTQIVLNDYISLISEIPDIQVQNDNLKKINSFLDKVITAYSEDTKELESKLKNAETSDQIQAIILGQ